MDHVTFQGGDPIDLGFGVNLAGQDGDLRGARLGLELGLPVYQDLNGPQLGGDWSITAGGKYMF